MNKINWKCSLISSQEIIECLIQIISGNSPSKYLKLKQKSLLLIDYCLTGIFFIVNSFSKRI